MLQIVHAEDDILTQRSVARVLRSVTGIPVVGANSVAAFCGLEPGRGKTVLVTDGDLGDGTCLDVIQYAVTNYGLEALGGTVLLLSGDAPPIWEPELKAARALGIATERLVKGASIDEIQAWWDRVRKNFGR